MVAMSSLLALVCLLMVIQHKQAVKSDEKTVAFSWSILGFQRNRFQFSSGIAHPVDTSFLPGYRGYEPSSRADWLLFGVFQVAEDSEISAFPPH